MGCAVQAPIIRSVGGRLPSALPKLFVNEESVLVRANDKLVPTPITRDVQFLHSPLRFDPPFGTPLPGATLEKDAAKKFVPYVELVD